MIGIIKKITKEIVYLIAGLASILAVFVVILGAAALSGYIKERLPTETMETIGIILAAIIFLFGGYVVGKAIRGEL